MVTNEPSEEIMVAVIATLAAAFAVMIGLKHLADLIVARSIFQAACRDEPMALRGETRVVRPYPLSMKERPQPRAGVITGRVRSRFRA